MRNKTILLCVFVLALVLWAGLIVLMNRKPPDSLNQLVFLAVWGMAITLTAMPVAYVVNVRLATPLGERGDMQRVLRQGGLAGALSIVLMALRFIRLLTWPIGAILAVVVVLVELLFYLRRR